MQAGRETRLLSHTPPAQSISLTTSKRGVNADTSAAPLGLLKVGKKGVSSEITPTARESTIPRLVYTPGGEGTGRAVGRGGAGSGEAGWKMTGRERKWR